VGGFHGRLPHVFRKELKKVNESKKSGASANDVYVPSLWYFGELMFLVDQETPGACNSTNELGNDINEKSVLLLLATLQHLCNKLQGFFFCHPLNFIYIRTQPNLSKVKRELKKNRTEVRQKLKVHTFSSDKCTDFHTVIYDS
jgi:hypothetical protein